MPKDEVTPKRLDKDRDRRLRALDRSAHAPVKKTPKRPKRGQQGGVTRGMALIVACVGLFLWGFHHGTTAPDGKWLLAVLILAAVLALFVVAGRRYRQRERADAKRTEDLEGRLKQYEGSDRYQDGT